MLCTREHKQGHVPTVHPELRLYARTTDSLQRLRLHGDSVIGLFVHVNTS
jgi:hypothetical protein